MTYLPTSRLEEIATTILPQLLDSAVIIHHRPHILRVVGLLPNLHPYAARVNIVADPVGGLWFTLEVENFYGLRDNHAETFHGRYTNLSNADLLRELRHLLAAFSREIDLQPIPPAQDLTVDQIQAWLTANTHTDDANIQAFLSSHLDLASDR